MKDWRWLPIIATLPVVGAFLLISRYALSDRPKTSNERRAGQLGSYPDGDLSRTKMLCADEGGPRPATSYQLTLPARRQGPMSGWARFLPG